MGLFGRRRRRADVAEWQDLWGVLAPLGGTVDAAGLGRVREAVLALTEEQATRVESQLGAALAALDTEEHARHIVEHPWTGPRAVFARRRFVRAVTRVLAAGPVACAQVVADPTQLRAFDRGPDATPLERVRPDPVGWTFAEALADRDEMVVSDVASDLEDRDVTDERGWPALRRFTRAGHVYPFEEHDPEGVWLDVTVDHVDLDDGSVTEAEYAHRKVRAAAWDAASERVVARVLEVFGPGPSSAPGTMPGGLADATVRSVGIELFVDRRGQQPRTVEASLDDDGELTVEAWSTGSAVDAAEGDPDSFLVRRVAEVLRDALPGLTADGRDVLGRLAHDG